MAFRVEDVVERLEDAGVRVDRGLTEADVKRVEKKFGFTFGPDHRALLRTALPLGDAWLNWRHATPAKIRERLQAPIEIAVVGVRTHGWWAAAWGERPSQDAAAEKTARAQLAQVPVLVPLYGHCYLPADPAPSGGPVFSVRPGEVTICAADLLAYVDVEFGSAAPPAVPPTNAPELAFWSALAIR